MNRRFMILKKMDPMDRSVPTPGAIYMYITIFSKIFLSETFRPIKAKRHVDHSEEGRMTVYVNGQGHMTKMAAMAVDSKDIKQFSSPEQEGL